MVDWIQMEKVVGDHFVPLEDHHSLEVSRYPMRQGLKHAPDSFPGDDQQEVEAAFLSETPDETLSKHTSYDDDDNEDLLFEELTAEVVGALTQGMDDELAEDINPYPQRCIDSTDFPPLFDNFPTSESGDQLWTNNMPSRDGTLTDDRFCFLSANRSADKEKALQWARRLDMLLSETANRSNSSTIDRNVESLIAADEFNNNPPSSRDLNLMQMDKFSTNVRSDESLSSVSTVGNASLKPDPEGKKTISTQTDFPVVEFKGGIVCSSAEAAQDVLKTRYSLPDITVKKSLITWSRWNIRDVIRSPIGQSSLWHPTQDVLVEQDSETKYISEINNEIERRAEAIAKLLEVKEAEREHSAERAAAALAAEQQRQTTNNINDPTTTSTQRHLDSDTASAVDDESFQRRKNNLPEDLEMERQQSIKSSPPATFVESGVNFIHRWCRYLSRPFARRPRESTVV